MVAVKPGAVACLRAGVFSALLHSVYVAEVANVDAIQALSTPTPGILVLQRADKTAGLGGDGIVFNNNFAYIVYCR